MFRSGIGYGGWGGYYPRSYLAAGLGYPYGALALPYYGYGYPGLYGGGYGGYGSYGGYGGGGYLL
jgi:hypothetical protein